MTPSNYSSHIHRTSFENATQIKSSDVLVGNLSAPLPAAETEVFVLHMPSTLNAKTMFFSLKVHHSVNRTSDVSNIVSAAIVDVPPERPQSTTCEPDTTTGGDTDSDDAVTLSLANDPDITTITATRTVDSTAETEVTPSLSKITTDSTVVAITTNATEHRRANSVTASTPSQSREGSNHESDSTINVSTTVTTATQKHPVAVPHSTTGVSTISITPTEENDNRMSSSPSSESITSKPLPQIPTKEMLTSTTSAGNVNIATENTKELPTSTAKSASNSSTTTRKPNTGVLFNNNNTSPPNGIGTDATTTTPIATPTMEQGYYIPRHRPDWQFAWKLALGTSLMVIFLIACPLIINTLRSRKARRNNGLWENWGKEDNLHRGPMGSWDGRIPYSSPGYNVCWMSKRWRSEAMLSPSCESVSSSQIQTRSMTLNICDRK